MGIDVILSRSLERVVARVGTVPACPFCGRDLVVRRTVIGLRPLVDGVQMKCAGPEGCGFRPDFDVPIDMATYREEMELRHGVRPIDAVYDAGSQATIEERLTALGYIEGDATDVG